MKHAWLVALALVSGCYTPPKKLSLRVELAPELASRTGEVTLLPRIAEFGNERGRGIVNLVVNRAAGPVRITLPGACPLALDTRSAPPGRELGLVMTPLFDVGPAERVVGLEQSFVIEARANCAEAAAARTSFTVSGGAPLANVSVSDRARTFKAQTAATLPEKGNTAGIVPVSARAARQLRTEITFQVELPGGRNFTQVLGISAVARSSGLADVGVTHPVLLGGGAWRLLDKPAESSSSLRRIGDVFELVPDSPGRYRLSDANGTPFILHSGRYDQTPLDCGRAACHAELSRSAQDSPMTQVLASDLGGCHELGDPACASACHTTGEPGTHDGGFTHVAAELGLPALPAEYEQLPRALQRLGGVGCLACHGPSKIPEKSSAALILRNDVCAVCHDAPPRYGHVVALEASRMGHADSSPKTRSDPACARCHTSWGALGQVAPSPSAAPFGIGCSTCHDVHRHGAQPPGGVAEPHTAATRDGLLRQLPLPATLPSPPASFFGVSRVCVTCHAPSSDTLRPEASAAALIAGAGGLDPQTGAALALASPHAASARGCLSCHDSGPAQLTLGKSHAFRATESACSRCHNKLPERDPSLATRARQLLARLDPAHTSANAAQPWHAVYERILPTPQATRALHDVLLVLEDPAADVHHPRYAKALLDAAEALAPGAPP